MKRLKYVLIIFILLITFIAGGEIYRLHCLDFMDYYRVSLYPETISEKLDDYQSVAEKQKMSLFILEDKTEENVIIRSLWTDKCSRNELDKLGYFEGRTGSFLGETLELRYYELDDYPNASHDNNSKVSLFVLGKNAGMMDVSVFEAELYHEGTDRCSIYLGFYRILRVISLFAILLILIYDSICRKKEMALRICSGKKESSLIMYELLPEIILLVIIIIGCFVFDNKCTFLKYDRFFGIMVFLAAFLIRLMLLVRLVVRIDYRAAVYDASDQRLLFAFVMTVKVFVLTCFSVCVAFSVMFLGKITDYGKYDDLYSEFKGYEKAVVYCEVYDDREAQNEKRLYAEMLSETPMVLWRSYCELADGQKVIAANCYAVEHIYKILPELKGKLDDEFCYVIYPEGITEEYLSDNEWRLPDSELEVKRISYKGNLNTPVFGAGNSSEVGAVMVKTPIIVLNMQKYFSDEMIEYKGMPEYYLALIKSDREKFTEKAKEIFGECRVKFFDIYKIFHEFELKNKMIFKGTVFLMLLSLCLNFAIMMKMTQIAFDMRKKEICLKKIHGVGFVKRNQVFFLREILVCTGNLLLVLLISSKAGKEFKPLIVPSVLIALVGDMFLSGFFIMINERNKIVKVLKGGSL